MTFIFAPFLAMLTAFSGTGNELLDAVDSKAYWKFAGIEQSAENLIPMIATDEGPAIDESELEGWIEDLKSPEFIKRQNAMAALNKAGAAAIPTLEKATKSENLEVATAATQILAKMKRVSSSSRVHRLMAIRGLGELKAKGAIPHLEKLLDSKEPFIGEYAKRSLANIRGEKYTPPTADPLAFEKDLAITYPSVTAVAHAKTVPRRGPVGIRAMLEQGAAMMAKVGGPFGGEAMDVDVILNEMTAGIVTEVFQRLGNIRMDSATLVIPTEVTARKGGVIVTFRGLYDHKRAKDFIKEEAGGAVDVSVIHGVEWFTDGDDMFLHFASDNLFIVVGGDDVGEYAQAVSERISGKDKEPASGPALELVDEALKDSTVFFAGVVPDGMRDAENAFKIVDSLVSSAKIGDDGSMELSARMEGNNEEELKKMFGEMQMGLAMGKGAVSGLVRADKKLEDIGKIMDSIKIERDGTTVTGSASIPNAQTLPTGFMMMMFGMMSVDMGPPPPVEAVPLEAVPEPEVPDAPEDASIEKKEAEAVPE